MLRLTSYSVLFTATTLAFTGCIAQDIRYRQGAAEFQRRDAIHDAQTHFRQSDYAIYSAMGYALYWPGLDSETGLRLSRRFSSRHLAGTSDILGSSAHRRYMKIAETYASYYNREMFRLLKQAHKL